MSPAERRARVKASVSRQEPKPPSAVSFCRPRHVAQALYGHVREAAVTAARPWKSARWRRANNGVPRASLHLELGAVGILPCRHRALVRRHADHVAAERLAPDIAL